MGGSESKTRNGAKSSLKNKIQDQWETVDHMDDFNIVKKKGSDLLGEHRKFQLDPIYDPSKQLKIYEMRQHSDDNTVSVYSAEKIQRLSKYSKNQKKKNTSICGNNNFFAVVTERIPTRLQKLCQVTFPQSLYLLKSSLKGYSNLYPKTGPVHVTDKMIGLNESGECKVWINQDFSSNHPNNQIKSLFSTRNLKLDKEYNLISPEYRDQKQMVENISDVIEAYCQSGKFPSDFGSLLKVNSRNFSNAIAFIEGFTRDRRIYVPDQILLNSVRTNPQQMKNIQERYRIYENEYKQFQAKQHNHNQNAEIAQVNKYQNNEMIHNQNYSHQNNPVRNISQPQNYQPLENNPRRPEYTRDRIFSQNNTTTNYFQKSEYVQPTNSFIYQNPSATSKPKVNFGGKVL